MKRAVLFIFLALLVVCTSKKGSNAQSELFFMYREADTRFAKVEISNEVTKVADIGEISKQIKDSLEAKGFLPVDSVGDELFKKEALVIGATTNHDYSPSTKFQLAELVVYLSTYNNGDASVDVKKVLSKIPGLE